jgi:hypothetical protein
MNLSTIPYKTASISTATSGANVLVTGVPGLTTRIYRVALTLAAGTIIFKDGTTALSGAMTLTSYGADDPHAYPLFVLTAGNDFVATLSGSNQLSGTIWYTQS